MASLADFAEVVAVKVTPSAVVGVASLADAGVASPADLAGVVTVCVVTLANAGVSPLADARVASLADAGWRPWPMLEWHP